MAMSSPSVNTVTVSGMLSALKGFPCVLIAPLTADNPFLTGEDDFTKGEYGTHCTREMGPDGSGPIRKKAKEPQCEYSSNAIWATHGHRSALERTLYPLFTALKARPWVDLSLLDFDPS